MRHYLESGWAKFGIAVETGVSNVEIQSVDFQDDYITGRWLATPKVIRTGASRPVAVELLNSLEGVGSDRLPEVALKFTKKYGPLEFPYRAGEPFRFLTHDWAVSVKQLQGIWAMVSNLSRKAAPLSIGNGSNIGAYLRFANGRITFITRFFPAFVVLEMASVPAPLLCVCANRGKGCKSPYFIASDKRERYCSEHCAQAAQRRVKLDWWNKNRKGKQNGAEKTR
jgi:hypothetical protein